MVTHRQFTVPLVCAQSEPQLNLLTGHTNLLKTALTVEMKQFSVILARKKHLDHHFLCDWTSKTVHDVPAPAALS